MNGNDRADNQRREYLFYRIEGSVQGVGFRAFVRRAAEALGVDGWVRNAADGSVEVEAAGNPEALRAFEERLRQGPPASRVTSVEARTVESPPDDAPTGFRIRR